jgi:hypothetical protein
VGLDGVYYEDSGKGIWFKKLPPPTDAEVSQVMKHIVQRINRLLDRRGLGSQSDPEEVDPLPREQPLLAELYGASLQGRIGSGPGAGERITTVGFEEEYESKKGGIVARIYPASACMQMSAFPRRLGISWKSFAATSLVRR